MLRIRRIDRTHEPVRVILITIAAALFLNPYESVVRISINADYNLREERCQVLRSKSASSKCVHVTETVRLLAIRYFYVRNADCIHGGNASSLKNPKPIPGNRGCICASRDCIRVNSRCMDHSRDSNNSMFLKRQRLHKVSDEVDWNSILLVPQSNVLRSILASDEGFSRGLMLKFIEAYMNLPSDAFGVRGWLRPQAPRFNGLLEPLTYRKRKPTSQIVQTNCFVLETHVIMFNFAWLVYYYNTAKMSTLGGMQNRFDYEARKVVVDEGTDTRALIVDGDDRIVVAFRGTSSGRNLLTDLKAFHVQLNRILPTASGRNTTGELFGSLAQEVLKSRVGQQAKVHRGFAEAFLSVADKVMHWIKELYDCDPRPVFLTGHSLRGALTTICALDCALKYQLCTSDIYDELVPASWRVSIAADIFTILPKVDYRHVGKKIMLTTAGDLFTDPNSLELSMCSGDSLSFVHHRKASYLLAMRCWCNRHEKGAYRHLFWSWPFSADDERRWLAVISTDARDEVRREHRRHFLHQDSMMDALNETKADNIEEPAFDNWSRLTRRLILNSAVHKT
ncbi:Lipase domain protein [Gracilaria domingensis]|nr:Lipase domain protein [Gracilaria domingensis]KAI0556885.1 Lipase domain protein [Gracilaria domingensis]